jgi:hypothetical protein
MRWAGHVARIGESRGEKGFWWGDLRERDYFEDGRMILKWFLRKSVGRALTGLSWLRIGTGGGLS